MVRCRVANEMFFLFLASNCSLLRVLLLLRCGAHGFGQPSFLFSSIVALFAGDRRSVRTSNGLSPFPSCRVGWQIVGHSYHGAPVPDARCHTSSMASSSSTAAASTWPCLPRPVPSVAWLVRNRNPHRDRSSLFYGSRVPSGFPYYQNRCLSQHFTRSRRRCRLSIMRISRSR